MKVPKTILIEKEYGDLQPGDIFQCTQKTAQLLLKYQVGLETNEIPNKWEGEDVGVEPKEESLDPIEIENLILRKEKDVARYITADRLIKNHHFACMTDTKELYVYQDGYYKPDGEVVVHRETVRLWGAQATKHDHNEIVFRIKGSCYVDRGEFNNDIKYTCVKNGILNLSTSEILPFSPDIKFTFQLPVRYDPEAACPKILEFLNQIAPTPEDVETLKQVAGYCLWRGMPIQKSVMLKGEGRNGKTVYINLLRAVLGKENVAGIELQRLERNDFAKGALFGKHANLHSEISTQALKTTGVFKSLTGGDIIDAEIKFGGRFRFDNFSKQIFSANELPRSEDTSYAFLRRWIILPFPFRFEGEIENKNLINELTEPEELSGFFNIMLGSLQKLMNNGWDIDLSDGAKELELQYTKLSDPVKGFIIDCVVEEPIAKITKHDLYEAYKVYCEDLGVPPESNNKFSRVVTQYITRVKPDAKIGKERAWGGIKLKNNNNEEDNKGYTDNGIY